MMSSCQTETLQTTRSRPREVTLGNAGVKSAGFLTIKMFPPLLNSVWYVEWLRVVVFVCQKRASESVVFPRHRQPVKFM